MNSGFCKKKHHQGHLFKKTLVGKLSISNHGKLEEKTRVPLFWL